MKNVPIVAIASALAGFMCLVSSPSQAQAESDLCSVQITHKVGSCRMKKPTEYCKGSTKMDWEKASVKTTSLGECREFSNKLGQLVVEKLQKGVCKPRPNQNIVLQYYSRFYVNGKATKVYNNADSKMHIYRKFKCPDTDGKAPPKKKKKKK